MKTIRQWISQTDNLAAALIVLAVVVFTASLMTFSDYKDEAGNQIVEKSSELFDESKGLSSHEGPLVRSLRSAGRRFVGLVGVAGGLLLKFSEVLTGRPSEIPKIRHPCDFKEGAERQACWEKFWRERKAKPAAG